MKDSLRVFTLILLIFSMGAMPPPRMVESGQSELAEAMAASRGNDPDILRAGLKS